MLDYFELLTEVKQGKTTFTEHTSLILDKIDKLRDLNAFLFINRENAIEMSIQSDIRIKNGNPRALEGMLIAIKDNISTKDIPTTCGSHILDNYVPVYNATVIERIIEAGGIIIGKTNLDEFAMGSSNETSYFGNVLNPHNNQCVPGGSSGGSAVAVTAGLCHAALGSDTGGSIRQPASFCGNVGLKPTYGRVSRFGLVAFASSLDQIGIFAADIPNCSILLDVITGKDKMDSTTANFEATNTMSNLKFDYKNYKIGVIPEKDLTGCDDEVLKIYNECLVKIQENGGQLVEIKFDYPEAWIPTYYILATAEASSNLARFDGVKFGFRSKNTDGDMMTATRSEGFGTEVKRRIMLGTFVLSSGYYDAYYKKAQQVRRIIYNNYKQIFSDCDAVFLPATPSKAFKIGEKADDPISMYLSDFFTVSANLAGIPAITIKAGKSPDNLPIGMQLQTSHFEENKLLQFANQFEKLFR